MDGPTDSRLARHDILERARAGADSVFRYIERAAEDTREGVRWQTLNDAGESQYRGDVYASGGIPLFLAEYFRLTRNTRALELGIAGARWCAAPGRQFLGDRFDNPWSLLGGRTGVGLTWLKLAEASGDAAQLDRACAVAAGLLDLAPGPATGLSTGAAGQGVFLLRLWQRTRDAQHLGGAVRCAEWLAQRAVHHEKGGRYWLYADKPGQAAGTPICHGVAGVGYFLLLLYRATQDSRWSELARAAAATLLREARSDRGGINWLPLVGADFDLDLSWQRIPVGASLTRCQWCNGAPGVGLFFAKAYEVLGDPTYLATAEAAGEATFAYGDGRSNPSYCHGLAGNTDLLIDLYRVTGHQHWLERAQDFAGRLLSYGTQTPEGDAWAADDPTRHAPDFMCGAAGPGFVFLRLMDPRQVSMALL